MARINITDAVVEFPVRFAAGAAKAGIAGRTGGLIDRAAGVVRALNGVTIDVQPGTRLGLIGHNGAGKSTLLRVMAGVYEPVHGQALIEGRIATLFNATPGLSMDSSGRENIITCGLHLGLSLREIQARADEIAAFTELGDYLDLPVRIYSAGMLMRLGFSIATSLNPEILLIDEGLGTGDASFASKAEARMQEMAERASIVVVASHSPTLLAGLCTVGVVLEHGRILATGPIDTVLKDYHASIAANAHRGDRSARRAAYTIATELHSTGQELPLELEEQALLEALDIKPGDLVMLKRYRSVLQEQGKPVSPKLDIDIASAALRVSPDSMELRQALIDLLHEHNQDADPDVMALIERNP